MKNIIKIVVGVILLAGVCLTANACQVTPSQTWPGTFVYSGDCPATMGVPQGGYMNQNFAQQQQAGQGNQARVNFNPSGGSSSDCVTTAEEVGAIGGAIAGSTATAKNGRTKHALIGGLLGFFAGKVAGNIVCGDGNVTQQGQQQGQQQKPPCPLQGQIVARLNFPSDPNHGREVCMFANDPHREGAEVNVVRSAPATIEGALANPVTFCQQNSCGQGKKVAWIWGRATAQCFTPQEVEQIKEVSRNLGERALICQG